MDEDGFVYVVDRLKRLIIRPDGFKVFPKHIESVVAESEFVKECVAVGIEIPNTLQGKLPVVFVVLKEECNKKNFKQNINDLCKAKLPEYAQPINVYAIDEFPLTPIGKVDYRRLEEMANENPQ